MLKVEPPKHYKESPLAIPDDWLKRVKKKLSKAEGGLCRIVRRVMHIKDYNDAMKFFRTYDNAASKGNGKSSSMKWHLIPWLRNHEPWSLMHQPRWNSHQIVF